MTSPLRVDRRTLLGVAGAVLLASRPGPAFAHAHLKAQEPAAGTTVPGPVGQLKLTFSEPLELAFSRVEVHASDKRDIKTGPLGLEPGHPTVLLVPLVEPLRAGRYMVDWHATASDTHKTQGHYEFVVAP